MIIFEDTLEQQPIKNLEDLMNVLLSKDDAANRSTYVTFEIDNSPYAVSEGYLENGTFIYMLQRGLVGQPAVWLAVSTDDDLDKAGRPHLKDVNVEFRADGSVYEVADVEKADEDGKHILTFKLQSTGEMKSSPDVTADHPSTAKEIADAFSRCGKSPKGMPSVWLVPGSNGEETPTYPNFAMKSGNFVKVHLVDMMSDFSQDEKKDAAEALRLLSTVPQGQELIFMHNGDAYEVDTFSIVPGKGLVVELRPWGQIDESHPICKTILSQFDKSLFG